jgi:ABC-type branched-subunit amino acid transport system ATPase component
MSDPTAAGDASQAATAAIEVVGVRKALGQVTALAGVDLTVTAGTLTALLGPNGAGKPVTELWLSIGGGRGARSYRVR